MAEKKDGGRAAKTISSYDFALDSFRRHGYRPVVVGREIGINDRTATRYWFHGAPEVSLPPISQVLEREMVAARAKLAAEKQAEREAAREAAMASAAEARAKEGQIIDLNRGAILQASVVAANLALGSRKLAEALATKLTKLAATPDAIDAKEAVSMLRQISATTAQITSAAHELMEMERLHLGEPTHIIEVAKADLTIGDIESRVDAAARALARYREMHGAIDAESEPVVPLIRNRDRRPSINPEEPSRHDVPLRAGFRVS